MHKVMCIRSEVTAGLDPKGTILTIKLANSPEPAHCYEPTSAVLKTAKSAT